MDGMKTFFICPVRDVSPEETRQIVDHLESEGWIVHWPHRDTDQDDPTGLRICNDNRLAMQEADFVHLVWNGESQGCLFDLGMAYAMHKPLITVSLPEPTEGKSFQNMAREWAALDLTDFFATLDSEGTA